ncbi:hypothetical protein KEM54_002147 [Ascosphaera aggregata]|nr:hypothetical protein KEM54_002147 [Ascosphaera aggregata]
MLAFPLPAPVKRIFDSFPLKTYPPDTFPSTSTSTSALIADNTQNRLFIFTDSHGARIGAPSFNPHCLKWQAYLKFLNVTFCTVPSNNHASPTGVLPFLLPSEDGNCSSTFATTITTKPVVASNKIQKWTVDQQLIAEEELSGTRLDVYTSLIDEKIRRAWVYFLYIDPRNFNSAAKHLYIDSTTSNTLVRSIIARQLQRAARAELFRAIPYIDVGDIESEADDAFTSLSTLLGERDFFSDDHDNDDTSQQQRRPGLFDASVFAYTHLILDEKLVPLRHNPLVHMLRKHENLVRHRHRLLQEYF